MSGRVGIKGLPTKGWSIDCVYDVREDGQTPDEAEYQSCEYCGNEKIRYVHQLSHTDYSGALIAGCVCAEKLSQNYVRPRQAERELKSRAERRARWLRRTWKTSRNQNPFLKQDDRIFTVFPDKFKVGKWKYQVDGLFSKRCYDTADEAKLAAFDSVWPGRVD
jgi:hypothetical protein